MSDEVDNAFGLGPSKKSAPPKQKPENSLARASLAFAGLNLKPRKMCHIKQHLAQDGLFVCLGDYGLTCINDINPGPKCVTGCAWACTECLLESNRTKAIASRPGQGHSDDVDSAFGLGASPEVAILEKARAIPRGSRPWSTKPEIRDDALAQAAELTGEIDALGPEVRAILAKAQAHPKRAEHNALLLGHLAREMGLLSLILKLADWCMEESDYVGLGTTGPWFNDALTLRGLTGRLNNKGPVVD